MNRPEKKPPAQQVWENSPSVSRGNKNAKGKNDPKDDNFQLTGTERIHYLENLVSKQLDLYAWCEEKVTTLATIDAILLSGATLFVEHIKGSAFPTRDTSNSFGIVQGWIENKFSVIMMIVMLLPIFVSLGITLWHVIPKMRSGASPSERRNHRSANGIHKFKDIPEYKKHIDAITENVIYEDLVMQIFGMNTNIWRNQLSIKAAVFFDLVGLTGFLCVVTYLVIFGTGIFS